MELQFLTPTEVWEGFNPKKDPLEASITSTEIKDNIVESSLFFTSETTSEGKVRVKARLFYDSRWRDNRPAILILPTLEMHEDLSDVLPELIREGYVVCSVDYSGADEGSTTFPASLSYASVPECRENLREIKTSARETPWFEWAKIARRAISLLQETHPVDENRISVLGIGTGAQIAWQTAGMDGRVSALVAINGGGYLWREGSPRFTTDNVPATDAERAFSTGAGAETYARFITCPTCYVVASNSESADVDRAGDILSLVQSDVKTLLISNGTTGQITSSVFLSLVHWMKTNFAHDPVEASHCPDLSFENIEGHLHLRLKNTTHFKCKSIHIAYGEPNNAYRHWSSIEGGQKVGAHEYTFYVPVSDVKDLVVAYATITYKDGSTECSPVIGVIPEKIGVSEESSDSETGRVVYTGDMGTGNFVASSRNAILDEKTLTTATGPFDINGVVVRKGKLSFFKNAKETFSAQRDAIFQFDAYSPERKEIIVTIKTSPKEKPFRTKVVLTGGEFWQKVSLSASDFKSEAGKTLPIFSDGKRFSFENAENVIFNNLLWI